MSDTEADFPEWFPKVCMDDVDEAEVLLNMMIGAPRAVFELTKKLWDNGSTVTYCYLRGLHEGNDVQHKKVEATIPEWEKYVHLKFQKIDDQDAADIRITFQRRIGSKSAIGKDARTRPKTKFTMNLSDVDPNEEDMVDKERGVILHEFGHALGLGHEHKSPVLPDTLTIKPEAAYKYWKDTSDWEPEVVDFQFLELYNENELSNYTRLDTTSIMMYFMPAELNAEGVEVKENTELSELDKAFAVIHYPRAVPSTDAAEWTLEHAVDVAGFTGAVKERILEAFEADPSAVTIRENLQAWVQDFKNSQQSS